MRFMYIVTPTFKGPPTPELMEAMGKLADREIKAGRMLDSGGRSWRQKRSSAATRSSNSATSRRRWQVRRNSCNSTWIICRAGKGHARFARLGCRMVREGARPRWPARSPTRDASVE